MWLKPFRCLFHVAVACLLLVGVVVAIECALLNRENTSRGQLQSLYESDAATLVSSTLHHTLRPNSAIESQSDAGLSHRVTLNSLGLRGPEPTIPKPQDVLRVLVLGDETIFASNVADADTATNHLQTQLQTFTQQRVEVLNAGVPGYCPLLSMLQFRQQLIGLHPDIVVLHYDLTDAQEDQRYRSTLNINASGEPVACTHPVLLEGSNCNTSGGISHCAIGRWAIRQLCETGQSEVSQTHRLWPLSTDVEKLTATRQSFEPILQLARMAKQISVRFILTATPSSVPRVLNRLEPDQLAQAWQKPRAMLLDFSAKQQIEFCDVVPRMTDQESAQYYSENGLTALGQHALASALAAHISKSPNHSARGILQIRRASFGG